MSNPEFQFNFRFKLHKSNISIGIDDEDYARLSAAYGTPLEDVMEEAARSERFNFGEAASLLRANPDAPSRLNGKRISFLGDSITSDRFSYFNIIRTAMEGRSTVQLQDQSVSAYKMVDIITNYCPAVTDFAPDVVHVLVGVNDLRRTLSPHGSILISVDEYARQTRFLIEEMRAIGAKLIFTTLSPIDYQKATTFARVNAVFREEDRLAFNDVLREAANQPGCALNDMEEVYRVCTPTEMTEADGIHMNAVGHRLLADRLLKLLSNC